MIAVRVFLVALATAFFIHPLFLMLLPNSSKLSLRYQLFVLNLAGLARRFGESWDEFILRVAKRSSICAGCLKNTLPHYTKPRRRSLKIAPCLRAFLVWINIPFLLTSQLKKAKRKLIRTAN
jgi:hypothetical protein